MAHCSLGTRLFAHGVREESGTETRLTARSERSKRFEVITVVLQPSLSGFASNRGMLYR